MNRYPTEEALQTSSKHMKRYSTTLAIREMKIKIMRYYTPIRMANT